METREARSITPVEREARRNREVAMRPIYQRIESQGIKQTWLADQMGIKSKLLWMYLHGYTRIREKHLRLLCALLDMSPNAILRTAGQINLLQQPDKGRKA